MPVPVPAGVEVELVDHRLRVRGPKGVLERTLLADMIVEVGKEIVVRRPSDARNHRAQHGLTRTLIANMVEGVTKGYEKQLELYGVGYRVTLQGPRLSLQLGFSHPVEIEAPEGVSFATESFVPTSENQYLAARITVSGINKEVVGQVAADIRAARKPEPYKGKGLRYRGEHVRRKPGKAAQAAGT
jgi:large subunit ribosomal protein L6